MKKKKPKVLIIDDDEKVRDSIRMALRREGYILYFAENGEQGLRLIREIRPIAIILDLRMPMMSGIEFLDKIDPQIFDPYSIMVLAGDATNVAIKECYQKGIRFFLSKPVNIYNLRGLLKSLISLEIHKKNLNNEIKTRKGVELELQHKIDELHVAIDKIQTLEGLLPMCSYCNKIRTHDETWVKIDTYVQQHTKADISHGVCPECMRKYYPKIYNKSKIEK
jgi:CheY-like chemotaxis protein